MMAEITLKLSRKPVDLHAARPVTGRKPEISRRAQAQGQLHPEGIENMVACCVCWASNYVETSALHFVTFQCWSSSSSCDV